MDTALSFANAYAPEHLIMQVDEAEVWASRVQNAGSVFIGPYTPESAGDYASGTNHTLPTGGWAKTYSGVSVASFQKTVTFQSITPVGLRGLAPAILSLANAEGLTAHARAVSIRVDNL
jgi:histidinol dehydrogenase